MAYPRVHVRIDGKLYDRRTLRIADPALAEALTGLPHIRTSGTTAYGSSNHGLAAGAAARWASIQLQVPLLRDPAAP